MHAKKIIVVSAVLLLGACGDDGGSSAGSNQDGSSGTGGSAAGSGSGGTSAASDPNSPGAVGGGPSAIPGGLMWAPPECLPDLYPEAGPCYPCAARHCCLPLASCATKVRPAFDGTMHLAYTGCYDGPLACARACFEREIGAAMSKASADVAHDCAVECGADFEQVLHPETQQPSYYTRDFFIQLVDCLAAVTDVPEAEQDGGIEDGGVAPESCAAACFDGWR